MKLKKTIKNLILIVVIAVIFFLGGMLYHKNNNSTRITSDLLSQQIQNISELATVEYQYTNMGKFENQASFYGWNVPFTTKSFIVSYDGKIKAGVDMRKVDVSIKGKNITVTIPQSQILSHEIDEKSLEIFDETKNIFNPITLSDYNQFSIDQKDKMESKVKEKGLLQEANKQAEEVINKYIKSLYEDKEELNISIHFQ